MSGADYGDVLFWNWKWVTINFLAFVYSSSHISV